MKRLVCFALACVLTMGLPVFALPPAPSVVVPSMIVIERETGMLLAEKNADEKLAPASVTKIMTLLLTVEAVDLGSVRLDEKLTVSRNAQSMGGSTACLGEGEQYTIDEMLKAVAVQSANDGAVALAEHIAGSEEGFVIRMNERAAQLGMVNTHFMNCHGLDAEGHYTTARDISIMSRELLSHPLIKNYTTIWIDSLRDGTFMLSNTNRLVRFYDGATGLKTGSTSKAGACISASAEKNGMEIIAVVMKASSSDERFETARKLLDFGFANFMPIVPYPENVPLPIPVLLGKKSEVQPVLQEERHLVVEKTKAKDIKREVVLAENVQAPVLAGQKLGELIVSSEGTVLATVPLVAAEAVAKLGWWDVYGQMAGQLFMK